MKRTFVVAVLGWFVLAYSLLPLIADEAKAFHDDATAVAPIPVAHRGLLRHAPENTMPAFAACLELGMGFELDVRTTKDGHLVVIHDDNVAHTTDGPSRSVRDMTLEELKRLDAGSWFDKAFVGVRVPTLDETLSLVSQRKRGLTIIALNVKDVTRAGEAKLVALVEKHNLLSESFAFDQSDEMSHRLKKLNPAFRIGQNVSRQDIEARLKEGLLDCFLLTSTPTAEEVSRLHELGKQALFNFAGEANRNPQAWKRAAAAGIDGFIVGSGGSRTGGFLWFWTPDDEVAFHMLKFRQRAPGFDVDIAPSDKTLAVANHDGTVRLYEMSKEEEEASTEEKT